MNGNVGGENNVEEEYGNVMKTEEGLVVRFLT